MEYPTFDNEKVLEKQVTMSNFDFYKVLPKITSKPFTVMRYFELPTRSLKNVNVILYNYPGYLGHWTFLCIDDKLKKIHFWDPYGRKPDDQWPYLYGYDKYFTPYYILSSIIRDYIEKGYKYYCNPFNVQGELINDCNSSVCKIIAENECGELICYRIMHKNLNDYDFYKKCIEVGPEAILKSIKSLDV